MNVVAIGRFPGDLELGCYGTLYKYVKNGHKAHLIVARNKKVWTEKRIKAMKESAMKIGDPALSFTDKIDFSAVTQDNVFLLRSFINRIKPSVAFIPSENSKAERAVLSKSAILACRQIKNILLYEVERTPNFLPCVYSVITEEMPAKKLCLAVYGKPSRKKLSLNKVHARDAGIDGFAEAFECSRMLLDGEFQP